MSKVSVKSSASKRPTTMDLVNRNLAKRKRAERRFRFYGIGAILFGFACLLILFSDIIGKGHGAFFQTQIQLQVRFNAQQLQITDPTSKTQLDNANYDAVIENALLRDNGALLDAELPALEKRQLLSLVSTGAVYSLKTVLKNAPETLNQTVSIWLTADDDVDNYVKSIGRDGQGFSGRLSLQQQKWVERWVENGQVRQTFNTTFFTEGDSREPEQAGIRSALMGSLYMLLVTIGLSFPIGISAAVYLEEYAPRNRLTDFIEVNINNLAAVPSIIFGLLGLAIFIGFSICPGQFHSWGD